MAKEQINLGEISITLKQLLNKRTLKSTLKILSDNKLKEIQTKVNDTCVEILLEREEEKEIREKNIALISQHHQSLIDAGIQKNRSHRTSIKTCDSLMKKSYHNI